MLVSDRVPWNLLAVPSKHSMRRRAALLAGLAMFSSRALGIQVIGRRDMRKRVVRTSSE
jgi:hypothetical protein